MGRSTPHLIASSTYLNFQRGSGAERRPTRGVHLFNAGGPWVTWVQAGPRLDWWALSWLIELALQAQLCLDAQNHVNQTD
jgi:hypothetical protein